jgi:serine-type D-Ala-D-Ala carboxypeptidase (penicillin-binding protein 5/6)
MQLRLLTIATIVGFSILYPKSFVSSRVNSGLHTIKGDLDIPLEFPSEVMFEVEEDTQGIVPQENLAKAGLLFDVKQKKITWEKEMKNTYPIASLTKMMVALLTVEDIKNGKFTWDKKVKVTREASRMKGSKVFLRYGETFTVRDLMKSAMIASGNDACYLLAQFNGGTEKQFVERMNKKAFQLGMRSTKFSNSTGLPAVNGKDNYSTPYDLLLLSNELLKHEEILAISSRKEEYIKHGRKQFAYRNHNKLVIEYEDEVDGLKTGFTNRAGFCIVATANRSNRRLIGIVLGVNKSTTRNMLVADMLNNYYTSIGLGRMGDLSKN